MAMFLYRPTLYPSDILPPFSKSGVVTDGGHFFTFDGRHLTMPGTCTYILAQDMQDGNFSVVANYNNGNLISVTITEPKESITLKNNGNVREHTYTSSAEYRVLEVKLNTIEIWDLDIFQLLNGSPLES